jgi:RNAse (barnase) inhibitor barstar
MKLPDLDDLEMAGVHSWKGDPGALATAAAATRLAFRSASLKDVASKAQLMDVLAKALALPEHFGDNWDALADCLEDDDWIGSHGAVVAISHSAAFRKAHAADWTTLEDILGEAADYWRERHKRFWVFVS